MSDELIIPTEEVTEPAVPSFVEYEVPGVGTVIAPEGEPGYRVRLPSGAVTAFPAHSGVPCEANSAADIARAIANPPAAPVPSEITPRQIRLWLLTINVTDAAIRAQLAASPAALIEWDYSLAIRRDHPLVSTLGAALGLTSAQIDAAFRAAALL